MSTPIITLVTGLILATTTLSAQVDMRPESVKDTLDPKLKKGLFPKKAFEKLDQLSISGYYRFVTNYRHLSLPYPHLANNRNNIFVGDDSQIPQLSMNISGALNNKTSFGTDFYIWSPMTGQGMIENVKGLNLGISLYGNFSTKFGNWNVQTGGINWYNLSPFTFQTNKGYNRYSLFERNPWDPNTSKMNMRYEEFYKSGAMDQDKRWGQQAFQGLILTGTELPAGFSGSFMYGKTQLNGGFSPIPNTSIGGRISKSIGRNYIAYNTFNANAYADSMEENRVGFNVHTLQYLAYAKNFKMSGEIGMGRTTYLDVHSKWGAAISMKFLNTFKNMNTIELHLYSISPLVLNNSAIFINSAIDPIFFQQHNSATQPILPAVASAMTNIGQLTNNRQGIDLNAQLTVWERLKLSLGTSMSSDIDKLSTQITYSHPINSLVLAHFWRWDFPTNVGPYENLSKIYRTVYETLNLTDLDGDGNPLSLKRYSNLEVNAKLKGKLAHKNYYLFYLGQYASAQTNWSPITVFSENAYLRTYYHQLEYYWELNPKLIWSIYTGYERIIANYKTEVDVASLRPKNQTGLSLAMGFDIRLSKNAGLYLRQRWFDYHDSSFQKDKYKGYESTLEIKLFF